MKARTLMLPVKKEYFEQIKSGLKNEEYRLQNAYWFKRLKNRDYTNIVVTLGYPSIFDHERRLYFPYNGYVEKVITHPHFGDKPVSVYAIKLNKGA